MLNPPDVINLRAITADPLHHPVFAAAQIAAQVLRLDKIHPLISGNKWFKLKYNLDAARQTGKTRLLSFGGAYSNHILALAALGQHTDMGTVGIIRGERPARMSHTLERARGLGMELRFVSRQTYAAREQPAAYASYRSLYPDAWLIREGGAGPLGLKGSGEIAAYIVNRGYSHVIGAVGTGTGMQGIRQAMKADGDSAVVMGVPVLKTPEVPVEWEGLPLLGGYHFGGYAKQSPALLAFMNEIFAGNGIPLDFVYTAKLFYGVIDQAGKGYFPKGSRLLLIHSGGLQGNDSLPAGTLHF